MFAEVIFGRKPLKVIFIVYSVYVCMQPKPACKAESLIYSRRPVLRENACLHGRRPFFVAEGPFFMAESLVLRPKAWTSILQ